MEAMTPMQTLLKHAKDNGDNELALLVAQYLEKEKNTIINAFRSGMMRETMLRHLGHYESNALERFSNEHYDYVSREDD